MKTKLKFTGTELVEAFKRWNELYNERPDEFDELGDPYKDAIRMADFLIELLYEK